MARPERTSAAAFNAPRRGAGRGPGLPAAGKAAAGRRKMLQGLLWAVVGANAAGSGYKFAGEAYPKVWPAAALVWARKLSAGGPGTKPG